PAPSQSDTAGWQFIDQILISRLINSLGSDVSIATITRLSFLPVVRGNSLAEICHGREAHAAVSPSYRFGCVRLVAVRRRCARHRDAPDQQWHDHHQAEQRRLGEHGDGGRAAGSGATDW